MQLSLLLIALLSACTYWSTSHAVPIVGEYYLNFCVVPGTGCKYDGTEVRKELLVYQYRADTRYHELKNVGTSHASTGVFGVGLTTHLGALKGGSTPANLAKWVADNNYITTIPGVDVSGANLKNIPRQAVKGTDKNWITVWTDSKEHVLKFGTGGSGSPEGTAKDEAGRGIGKYIAFKKYGSVWIEILSPYTTLKKATDSAQDLVRAQGQRNDIETVEWSLRSLWIPANEDIEDDHNLRFLYHVNRLTHGGLSTHPELVPLKGFQGYKIEEIKGVFTMEVPAAKYDAALKVFNQVKDAFLKSAHMEKAAFEKKWKVAIVKASTSLVEVILPEDPTTAPTNTTKPATTTTKDVCFEGYVMDRYCIDKQVLQNDKSAKTMVNPEKHSMMCLVDMGPCRESGYNVLAPVKTPTDDVKYCPAYDLGKPGDATFDKVLAQARADGSKDGCKTCTGGSDGVKTGLKYLFVGTVKTADKWSGAAPIKLTVTKILKAGSDCPNGKVQTPAPCDSYVLPEIASAMGTQSTKALVLVMIAFVLSFY